MDIQDMIVEPFSFNEKFFKFFFLSFVQPLLDYLAFIDF